MTVLDIKATEATRARYARIAPIYDWLELLPERRYRTWRRHFWQALAQKLPSDGRLLEIGVGTGKNMPYWPKEAKITAIDLTPGMLEKAQQRAMVLGINAHLALGDAQALDYSDDTFDIAAATFVLCSVPDPLQGLKEIQRVVRPGGWVFLMEHVRSQNPFMGMVMDLLNPFVLRMMGLNINRDTVGNVTQSDLQVSDVSNLGKSGIFKMIVARIP
jgi:ubiquinone/menaquinone biosynthesis C-methylase UbiE